MSRENKEQREVKGNRKENLNSVRGKQKIIDPERGPSNK
ncbi:hypothetical protein DCCM_3560 [Desulfocucumis palustris]|uniref:Uncharacterized protein n=1 Tax=Desulfocucumis palustris TaxID=1898651 RepID=A0A2L2XE86_9FIRM|nr:hypothetical protein DCCM_3560 [Desulfocucumis palustris]